MTEYTNEQILKNREIAIAYLMSPEPKKLQGWLDAGGNQRCCLGHFCHALGIPITGERGFGSTATYVAYGDEEAFAPEELINKLGLFDRMGSAWGDDNRMTGWLPVAGDEHRSLAAINDNTELTPQEIGAIILPMINGGTNTPFRKLD